MTDLKRLQAPWLAEPALAKIFAALGADAARLVGGCVRDGLLGLGVSDIDLATTHAPEQTIALAQACGIKAVPTGIAHGTITLVVDHKAFEVTTLREDVETDGRHATVAFTDDWQADAARRDFTINALYADADGQVYDYFDGRADLDQGCVRFIGDPTARIQEDALRILRFYRFSARFSKQLDVEGRAACRHWASAIKSLSRERVQGEWLKLLDVEHPALSVTAMHEDGVLKAFLPEAQTEGMMRLLELETTYDFPRNPLRRFAALLPADGTLSEKVARRLKFSRADREHLVALAQRVDGSIDAKALVYRCGAARAIDLAALSDVPVQALEAVIETASAWQPPQFPLKGKDLLAHTPLRGAQIGRALFELETRWIDSSFSLSKSELMALAQAL